MWAKTPMDLSIKADVCGLILSNWFPEPFKTCNGFQQFQLWFAASSGRIIALSTGHRSNYKECPSVCLYCSTRNTYHCAQLINTWDCAAGADSEGRSTKCVPGKSTYFKYIWWCGFKFPWSFLLWIWEHCDLSYVLQYESVDIYLHCIQLYISYVWSVCSHWISF